MKLIQTLAAVIGCALLLAACGMQGEPLSPSSTSPPPSAPSSGSSQAPTHQQDLLAGYLDPSQLPQLEDVPLPSQIVQDDRTLILEATVNNQLELQVYQFYALRAAADFQARMELVGQNESFSTGVENEAHQFEQGLYPTQWVLHRLWVLTPEEISQAPNDSKDQLLADIAQLGLDRYAVVALDVSWELNEASLLAGPQVGNGRYLRYYLLGTTPDCPDFLLYNVYWDSFL